MSECQGSGMDDMVLEYWERLYVEIGIRNVGCQVGLPVQKQLKWNNAGALQLYQGTVKIFKISCYISS